MLKEKTFTANNVVFNYAEGPESGPPLLFLHGLSACWQAGMSIIPHFISRFHAYAMDFRGHGKSARKPGHYQVEDYISDTTEFIEKKIDGPLFVFGHSLGGRVAMSLAATMPNQVRAIIVGETPLSSRSIADRTDFSDVLKKWHNLVLSGLSVDDLAKAIGDMPAAAPSEGEPPRFKDLPGWDQTYLRFTAHYLKQADLELLLSLDDRVATDAYSVEKLFPKIKCPVLFIQGDPSFGALMTETDLNAALTAIKSSSFVKIDGVGHDIHLQNAEPVRRAMMYFLESLI